MKPDECKGKECGPDCSTKTRMINDIIGRTVDDAFANAHHELMTEVFVKHCGGTEEYYNRMMDVTKKAVDKKKIDQIEKVDALEKLMGLGNVPSSNEEFLTDLDPAYKKSVSRIEDIFRERIGLPPIERDGCASEVTG